MILRKKLWEGLAKKGNLAITSFAKKENNLCKAKINARGQRFKFFQKMNPQAHGLNLVEEIYKFMLYIQEVYNI